MTTKALSRNGQLRHLVFGLPLHQRVADYLKSRPFPHYEAAAGHPGLLMRIDEDGSHTLGRFVNRRFEPSADPCDS
jgi:hypothetical protein